MSRHRLRYTLAACALIVTTAVAATSAAAAADTRPAAAPAPGPKPTIVLEHGAWADASSWAAVIQRLYAALSC